MTKQIDFKSFLIAKLRAASRKWPAFSEAKQKAKVAVKVIFDEKTMTLTAITKDGKESFMVNVHKKGQSRDRVAYRCAHCGQLFFDYEYLPISKGKNKGKLKKTSIVAADHVIPVVSEVDGFQDWNTFIDRLFFGKLQILCNYPGEREGKQSCHHVKTQAENAQRKNIKKKS